MEKYRIYNNIKYIVVTTVNNSCEGCDVPDSSTLGCGKECKHNEILKKPATIRKEKIKEIFNK